MLLDMSVRLRWRVVNPNLAEIRSSNQNRSGGAFWNPHPPFSPDDFLK
jgi:hypothetical protein